MQVENSKPVKTVKKNIKTFKKIKKKTHVKFVSDINNKWMNTWSHVQNLATSWILAILYDFFKMSGEGWIYLYKSAPIKINRIKFVKALYPENSESTEQGIAITYVSQMIV